MRRRLGLLKIAGVAAMAGSLALTGTAAAAAEEDTASNEASVFLDGIRALDVTNDPGGRDEVKIVNASGKKIWPVTGPYVSMAKGQRVEVDKYVAVGSELSLVEVDDANPDDYIGGIIIDRDASHDYIFCCGDGGKYRIGALA